MASRSRKKKRKSLLILFGCIVICAGAYTALSVYDAKKQAAEEAAEETEEISLLSLDKDDISSIEVKNSFGSMKLLQKDGEWLYKKDKKFPLNQDYADDMAGEADLTALRLIAEDPEDLSDYGLENPAITAVFTTADGEQTLYIGEQSPSDDSGYYCYLNDDTTVYEIEDSVYTAFNYSVEQMMVLEDVPDISSDQITKLTIKNPNEFDFTAENKSCGDSTEWTIEEPYSEAVQGSTSDLTTFLGSYEDISYDGAVEYNCSDFSKYGLDEENPATALIQVDYYELVDVEDDSDDSDDSDSSDDSDDSDDEEVAQEQVDHTAKIIIGNQNDDGDYYARVNDSSYVYLLTESEVDNLIPDKAYTYVEQTISRISTDAVTQVVFKTEDNEYKITSRTKTTQNDDGEDETETKYFFNKKTMETEDFSAIMASFTLLESAKEIPEKDKKALEDKEPMLTISIKTTGRNQDLEFIAYDKSYCAIKDGDGMEFLIDKRDVDGFIEKLEAQAEE
jgi:hypothetical protein